MSTEELKSTIRRAWDEVLNKGDVGFPPKYVPLEAVFIVILWQCSKYAQRQSAAVVGAVGSVVNAQRCPSLVGSGRLSTRRHCPQHTFRIGFQGPAMLA